MRRKVPEQREIHEIFRTKAIVIHPYALNQGAILIISRCETPRFPGPFRPDENKRLQRII